MMKETLLINISATLVFVFIFMTAEGSLPSVVAQLNEPNQVALGVLTSPSNITKLVTTSDNFSATGSVSSLIYLTDVNNTSDLSTAKKFILSGSWNLKLHAGTTLDFIAKFSQVLDDGTRWHNYEFVNFKMNHNTRVHLTTENSVIIPGTLDIKLDNIIAWENVKSTIIILNGKTIVFALDNHATGDYFRDQPIYGIIQSIKI